jgi:hypothetical protein
MTEPTAPDSGDATFDAKAEAFLAALPAFRGLVDPPQRQESHPGSLSAFGTAAYRRWLWRRDI